MKFRKLKAEEISVRVARCGSNANVEWAQLLLFCDSRAVACILDESVGAFDWQVSYTNNNANCILSIYDAYKGEWIRKENVGTPAQMEPVKSLASDAFKRAAGYWGIGRELYSAGNIFTRNVNVTKNQRGYFEVKDKFTVQEIAYDGNGNIIKLVIWNDTIGTTAYVIDKTEDKK